MIVAKDILKIGNKTSAVLKGDVQKIKNGSILSDQNENKFIVESVGISRSRIQDEICVLISPDIKSGTELQMA